MTEEQFIKYHTELALDAAHLVRAAERIAEYLENNDISISPCGCTALRFGEMAGDKVEVPIPLLLSLFMNARRVIQEDASSND